MDAPAPAITTSERLCAELAEANLAEKLRSAARHHGVSPDTLLNVWLKEHVASEPVTK
jgi:hypothetical protein